MKKKFTILLCSVCLSVFIAGQIHAQPGSDDEGPEHRFGARAGLAVYSLSYEYGGTTGTTGNRPGLAAGLFAEFRLTDMFSVQPELLFVQKGSKKSEELSDILTASINFTETTLNYIDIPLLGRANIQMEGEVQPYVIAGPSVGILINANAKNGSGSADISDHFKSLNYGLTIGGGIHYRNWVLDVRYDLGLANIYEGGQDFFPVAEQFDAKNIAKTAATAHAPPQYNIAQTTTGFYEAVVNDTGIFSGDVKTRGFMITLGMIF